LARALPHCQACEIDSLLSADDSLTTIPTRWNVVNEVEFLQSRTLAYCWLWFCSCRYPVNCGKIRPADTFSGSFFELCRNGNSNDIIVDSFKVEEREARPLTLRTRAPIFGK
jgi:hypothetical protein